MKFHQTSPGRHNDARKRVRMACAFGYLTIGPLHNVLGRDERPDQAGLLSAARVFSKSSLVPRAGSVIRG